MNNNLLKVVIVAITFFLFTSCEEKISYGWGEINESLGLLQDAREELEEEISNLEYEDYDTSELENIDDRIKKVERILEKSFN